MSLSQDIVSTMPQDISWLGVITYYKLNLNTVIGSKLPLTSLTSLIASWFIRKQFVMVTDLERNGHWCGGNF
jgi:hypothetical protein